MRERNRIAKGCIKRTSSEIGFYVHEVLPIKEGATPFNRAALATSVDSGGDTPSMNNILSELLYVKGHLRFSSQNSKDSAYIELAKAPREEPGTVAENGVESGKESQVFRGRLPRYKTKIPPLKTLLHATTLLKSTHASCPPIQKHRILLNPVQWDGHQAFFRGSLIYYIFSETELLTVNSK